MKITSVDVILADGETSVKGTAWNPIFVRINTDEGISGYGEAGLCYGNSQMAGFGICQDFAKLIIGMDPMKTEGIWDFLHRKTFWGMGGGMVVYSGISAIDIALWDIKGKALNCPVYELLGGKRNDRLRAYASQIQFDWDKTCSNMITPADYARATQKAMQQGYTAIKVDPIGISTDGRWMPEGWSNYGLLSNEQIRVGLERIEAIRTEGGEELDIIVELHALTDCNTAVQFGKELEKYQIFYLEEPTQPLNPDLFREIADKVDIPLATGERSFSRWGFRPFFENRSLGIIQPDLCNTGGITEGKKICDMAHVYDVGVQVHVCGGPISTAAALQVEAVIPNFVIHEFHAAAMLEGNISTCTYNYQPKDGFFEVPSLPGIGQEVTEETIKKSRVVTVR